MLILFRQRRIRVLAWLGAAVLAVGGAWSLANLTDQSSNDNPVTVGTVVLGVNPATALVTFAGMQAGNEIDATLTVANSGTGALRYAMTVVATDADGKHLEDVLELAIERRTGCGGSVLETLYSGSIGGAAFGNAQAGPDTGDRELGVGASEILCFRAFLPADTDPLYSGAATTATLTFAAEQVAGNP